MLRMSQTLSTIVDKDFTRRLPKIELHAHLTGSITPQTLHEIWASHKDSTLEDPLSVLSPEKAYNITTFFPLFSTYTYHLISTPKSVMHSTTSVLHDFRNDGIIYLELRTTPRSSPSMTKGEYIALVLSCIENFEGRKEMPTYLILSIDRRNTALQAMETVDLAIRYRSKGNVGVDLCGDPGKGDVSIFKQAFEKARANGLGITLHFAETSSLGLERELETLLEWQPDRLGHVIHVEAEMRRDIVRRGIGVELCVSCNVLAEMSEGGFEGHHFGRWWCGNGNIALCVSSSA